MDVTVFERCRDPLTATLYSRLSSRDLLALAATCKALWREIIVANADTSRRLFYEKYLFFATNTRRTSQCRQFSLDCLRDIPVAAAQLTFRQVGVCLASVLLDFDQDSTQQGLLVVESVLDMYESEPSAASVREFAGAAAELALQGQCTTMLGGIAAGLSTQGRSLAALMHAFMTRRADYEAARREFATWTERVIRVEQCPLVPGSNRKPTSPVDSLYTGAGPVLRGIFYVSLVYTPADTPTIYGSAAHYVCKPVELVTDTRGR